MGEHAAILPDFRCSGPALRWPPAQALEEGAGLIVGPLALGIGLGQGGAAEPCGTLNSSAMATRPTRRSHARAHRPTACVHRVSPPWLAAGLAGGVRSSQQPLQT